MNGIHGKHTAADPLRRISLTIIQLSLFTLTASAQITPTGSPALDYQILSAAIANAGVNGGKVLLDGDFCIDQSILVPVGPVRLELCGTPGSSIEYVGSGHAGQLLRFQPMEGTLSIRSLELDGSYNVGQVLRVENPSDDVSTCVGSVFLEDCAFSNGRQLAAWNVSGTQLEGVTDLAAGVYIRGALAQIVLDRCQFRDFNTTIVPATTGGGWGVGSRGAAISTEQDWVVDRPRTVTVVDCIFQEVYSKYLFTNTAGFGSEQLQIDADGLHVNALQLDQAPHADSLALIEGCTFKNCAYRSVKLQNARAIVRGNSFYRSVPGLTEVQSQMSGMTVTGNRFEVAAPGHISGGGVVTSTTVAGEAGYLEVSHNDFVLRSDQIRVWAAVGCGTLGPAVSTPEPLGAVHVIGNRVRGAVRSFLYVRYASERSQVTVVRNRVHSGAVPPLGFVGMEHGTSVGTLGGEFVANTWSGDVNFEPVSVVYNLGLPVGASLDTVDPDCWACNKGIAAP